MAARKPPPAPGTQGAPRSGARVQVDVADFVKRGLKSVVGAYCHPCCVEGCDKLSLDQAASVFGATMKCSGCGGAACQGHYYLTPTVPPRPFCVDCLYASHRLWRRDKGLGKPPRRKDFVDVEFVDAK